MIDIMIIAWLVWGVINGYNMHICLLAGDILAVFCVLFLYKIMKIVEINDWVLETYKDAIIHFYLWLEPLRPAQVHKDYVNTIVLDLFSYFILLGLLLAIIGIIRNMLYAFSERSYCHTVYNQILGFLRNGCILVCIIILAPDPLLETYWINEIVRNSLLIQWLL